MRECCDVVCALIVNLAAVCKTGFSKTQIERGIPVSTIPVVGQ